MHLAIGLIPLHFSLGLASSGSSSKEVVSWSESATESDSWDSEAKALLRLFGRNYRTGGMSDPNVFEADDESWLDMPQNVLPLQAIGPNLDIVEIEDDSSPRATEAQKDSEDVVETLGDEKVGEEGDEEEKEEEEEEEVVADEDVAEGETIGASSSQA